MAASSKRELAALSRVFSPAVIHELGSTGKSALLARLLHESRLPERLPVDASLADAFEMAFSTLRQLGNRDDYVYRSALTQKIVLGRHNLRTATVLNEFRVGSSKVDLVILNGTSSAYEIKSERDSFQRLSNQLADYLTAFARVNVVTSPRQEREALRFAPAEVGILVLSSRFRLQTAREAAHAPERTDPVAILSTLRVEEATRVLRELNVPIPDVPNTRRRAALRALFENLGAAEVHDKTVEVLKSSRSNAELEAFIHHLPAPLNAAILAAHPRPSARRNLQLATQQSISTVLAWK